MKSQAQEDTAPEMALRRALHAKGYRYRVHHPVPGAPRRKIDIAFIGPKVAVRIMGCFWHGCPQHGTWPKSNSDWWRRKIERNKNRDEDTARLLAEAGWRVVTVWEHESPADALERVECNLEAAGP